MNDDLSKMRNHEGAGINIAAEERLYAEYVQFLAGYGLRPPRRPPALTGDFFDETVRRTRNLRDQILNRESCLDLNPCQNSLTLIAEVFEQRGGAPGISEDLRL